MLDIKQENIKCATSGKQISEMCHKWQANIGGVTQ